MKIKTFTASSSLEAMSLVKEALGDEAVIISTETLTDGQIRVTAAVDEHEEISFNDRQEVEVQKKTPNYTDRLLRESLEYHDVIEIVKQRILHAVRELNIKTGLTDDKALFKKALYDLYQFTEILNTNKKCKVFMGTPGSGKSTAIAKTAMYARRHHKSCCIVSVDNVRAGANKQLEAFASILEQDFFFCQSERNLFELIQKAEQTYDFILIDTAGINPFIGDEVTKIEKWLEVIKGDEILVMSAGTNTFEAIEIAEVFTELGAKYLLPTRLDLTRRLGSILSVASCCELKLGGASVSSNIANGLAEVTPEKLTQLILS